MEIKKHVKQMSEREINKINVMVKRVYKERNLKMGHHAVDRMTERINKCDVDIVKDVMKYYHIIEYKRITNERGDIVDKRVVLRSTKEYGYDSNYIVVYSLMKNTIVTFWKNKVWNQHENVDLSVYDAFMQIY